MTNPLVEFNSIIITDDFYKSFLVDFKSKNPHLNFKIYTKKEILEIYDFYHDSLTISEIINQKKVSLKSAKEILNTLHHVSIDNDFDNLLELKKKLENSGYISRKEHKKLLFINKIIYIFELEDDIEFINFLDMHGVLYKKLKIFDICSKNNSNSCIKYKNRYEQFFYTCNKICELLNEGINPNRIKIRCNSNEFLLYINFFEKNTNLEFKYETITKLSTDKDIQSSLRKFYKDKKINKIEINDISANLHILNKLIETYKLDSYEFAFGYNLLLELINDIKNVSSTSKGIIISNSFNFCKDDYIFELDFDNKNYPIVFSDDGFYQDIVLEKHHMNASYTKTKLDLLKKRNLIDYTHFFASYCNSTIDGEVFPSSMLNTCNLENNDVFLNKVFLKIPAELNYLINRQFNERDSFNQSSDLEKYDFQFKRFKAKITSKSPISYTKINDFFSCPFYYYCLNILKIQTSIQKGRINLGTFVHDILNGIYDTKFDYNSAFEKSLNKDEYDYNEKIFYRYVIKDRFKITVDYLLYHEKNSHFIGSLSETGFEKYINGYLLFGRVDSIYFTEYEDNKYATIIDYKTGNTAFDENKLKFGLSMQLPIYYVLLKNASIMSDYKIGGIFIQNVIPKIKKDGNEFSLESYKKSLSFKGLFIDDQNYVKSFDSSIGKNESTLKSIFINSKDITNEILENFSNIVEEKILEYINKIENNEYQIFPIKEKKTKKCDNCPYKNICYHDNKTFNDLDLEVEDVEDETV